MKYHAFHCALIDVLTTVYFLAFAIVVAVYSAVRYGTEEIPPGDVVMNFWIVSLFAVPWGLRGWCLVQITRRGTARIKGLGSLARRLVYGDGSLPVGR
ncbi:hypothetical protein [Spirillospora sp. NPDC047279]|uniref:hypothetical protein n=1 Tax=Spirillospora sp. NPDC047279 TaxID=3155478 RepID=UPI0033E0D718